MRVVLTRREALDSPDGVSIFIVSLAQALCELNHEVKIIVGCLQSQAEYERLLAPRLDLPILALSRTPLSGLASVVAWSRAKWVIDRFAPDLVIHSEAVPLPLLNDDQLWTQLSAGAGRIVERFDAFRVARQYIKLADVRGSNVVFAANSGSE
jgi:hypothetical protein